MTLTDRVRLAWTDAQYDFWLDLHGAPRRRRRTERAELRRTLTDIAQTEGMSTALHRVGSTRDLARAVGEGYANRPRWTVGAYTALPVFALLAYGYLFSSIAFLEGVRASGVTGKVITSHGVIPWFGTRFSAQVHEGGGLSIAGDLPWAVFVLPLIVFVATARPWRAFGHRERVTPADAV